MDHILSGSDGLKLSLYDLRSLLLPFVEPDKDQIASISDRQWFSTNGIYSVDRLNGIELAANGGAEIDLLPGQTARARTRTVNVAHM